jgi:methyl-accepting chemotaxis protein
LKRDEGAASVGGPRWSGGRRLASDTKVLAGVGALLALLAVAVAVAVILIVSLEDDANELSQRHVLYAAAIHEATLSAKGMANDQRGYLLSGEAEYLDQLRVRTDEARAAFAEATAFAVGESQREAVRRSQAGFEGWLKALNADIAAYQRGSREEAITASAGSTRQLRKTYEQSLAHASALGASSIDSATTSISSSASRSVTLLLVYLALALVVGVGVALWVVRAVLKPAYVLSENAVEVLTRSRVLVEEDDRGSHHGVAVEVPLEVVNALAESALQAQEGLRPRGDEARGPSP